MTICYLILDYDKEVEIYGSLEWCRENIQCSY